MSFRDELNRRAVLACDPDFDLRPGDKVLFEPRFPIIGPDIDDKMMLYVLVQRGNDPFPVGEWGIRGSKAVSEFWTKFRSYSHDKYFKVVDTRENAVIDTRAFFGFAERAKEIADAEGMPLYRGAVIKALEDKLTKPHPPEPKDKAEVIVVGRDKAWEWIEEDRVWDTVTDASDCFNTWADLWEECGPLTVYRKEPV